MNRKLKIGGDLKPTPKDDRDFGLLDVYTQIPLSEVPNTDWDFYTPLEVKDQKQTQECTGHGVAVALEAHEGEIINPSVQYAFIKELTGDPTDTGADLRTAMKSGTKIGGVKKKDCDFGVDKYDGDFLADIKNYPEGLKDKAKVHQQKSFFKAHEGKYDIFDNFRTWLYKFRDEEPVIVTGVMWQDNWTYSAVIPKEPGSPRGGHCIVILPAQKIISGEPYLKVQNSYGQGVGEQGFHWFPREVINKLFTYGGYIYRDKDPEEVKQLRKGENMQVRSNLFELNLRDLGNGLLVSVISAVLLYVQQALSTGGFTAIDINQVLTIALNTGLAYIVKNLFEDAKGENMITGAIKKALKK